MNSVQPHPHFDDRGTLSWHRSFEEAKAEARATGRMIFIELGRELCSQCRSFVQGVVPRPDVGPILKRHFVALAADADECEPEVLELAAQLEDAEMLPFVLFTDSDGGFLAGSSGVVEPKQFVQTLQRLGAGT
ncbi:MAG: thioredoxin family protein [Planctomycetes bacterium]|nr:thioredoxin family protein [Planctomycetota bacterium]